jgi:hypothetical protein
MFNSKWNTNGNNKIKMERDRRDSEVVAAPTRYGKALEALQSLDLSVGGLTKLAARCSMK